MKVYLTSRLDESIRIKLCAFDHLASYHTFNNIFIRTAFNFVVARIKWSLITTRNEGVFNVALRRIYKYTISVHSITYHTFNNLLIRDE